MALALLALLATAASVPAQSPQFGDGGPQYQRQQRVGQDPIGPIGDNSDPVMQAKRIRALNAERQKELVAETNKLVKLVAELNAEINSAQPTGLSDDQLRKVAEIEKLAHSIREKMSSSVNGIPQLNPPPGMIPLGME